MSLSQDIYNAQKGRIILRTLTYFRLWEEPDMTRTASILAAAVTLLAVTPAFAGQAQGRSQQSAQPTAQRVVMLCATDSMTQQSFRREHGSRPVFVTADQVLRARDTGQGWTTPRCMDAREHGRLLQMINTRASL